MRARRAPGDSPPCPRSRCCPRGSPPPWRRPSPRTCSAGSAPTGPRRSRPHREVAEVVGGEDQVGPERHRLAEQRDGIDRGLTGRTEVALLVELAVVRQVALRDDAEHLPPVQHRGDVEQLVVDAQRQADDQQGRQFRRRRAHVIQAPPAPLRSAAAGGRDPGCCSRPGPARGTRSAPRAVTRPARRGRPSARRCTGDRPGEGAGSRRRRRESVRVTRVEARHRGRLDLPSTRGLDAPVLRRV